MKKTIFACLLALLAVGSTASAEETGRCIRRTQQAIHAAAYDMDDRHPPKEMELLRGALVRNLAASLALKKGQQKPAMFLTLEARRTARELLEQIGNHDNKTAEVDPEETAAASGGQGKDADAATAEAEKRMPPIDALAKRLPDLDGIEEE